MSVQTVYLLYNTTRYENEGSHRICAFFNDCYLFSKFEVIALIEIT